LKFKIHLINTLESIDTFAITRLKDSFPATITYTIASSAEIDFFLILINFKANRMGCGCSSSNAIFSINAEIPKKAPERKASNEHGGVKSRLSNQRNSIQMDVLQTADFMLTMATNDDQRLDVYLMKGNFYFDTANTMYKASNLDYFRWYRKAYSEYKKADSYDTAGSAKAVLGMVKCLVKLCQFEQAFAYLQYYLETNNKNLTESVEFWRLLGICNRKLAKIWNGNSLTTRKMDKLEKANSCLANALKMSRSGTPDETNREIKITERLLDLQKTHDRDFTKYTETLANNTSLYESSTNKNHTSEKELYRIVSIDGSGVRTILPQLMLCEIEKRCKCHLTDVFQMFTGTSTGE
jgi:tetratricopeptide (TPR) repeat protein